MLASSGQPTVDEATAASTECHICSDFEGVTGSFAPKPVCLDMQFYIQQIGKLPIQKTQSLAVSGRMVVVLKFRRFACVFFNFMAPRMCYSVLICTGVNLKELLRKKNLIPCFELQDKIKGKMRKALQSTPLKRTKSSRNKAKKEYHAKIQVYWWL